MQAGRVKECQRHYQAARETVKELWQKNMQQTWAKNKFLPTKKLHQKKQCCKSISDKMQLYLGIAAILFRTQVLIDLGDLYCQFMGT